MKSPLKPSPVSKKKARRVVLGEGYAHHWTGFDEETCVTLYKEPELMNPAGIFRGPLLDHARKIRLVVEIL